MYSLLCYCTGVMYKAYPTKDRIIYTKCTICYKQQNVRTQKTAAVTQDTKLLLLCVFLFFLLGINLKKKRVSEPGY